MAFEARSIRQSSAVSSMSSLASAASVHDANPTVLPETSHTIVSSSTLNSLGISSLTHTSIADRDHETPVDTVSGPSGMLLAAPMSIMRPTPLSAVSATGPGAMAPNNNTVAEFLYQLTKMLTEDNRDVIEWVNGQINVHDPPRLEREVLCKYFRHSKFASFQRQLNYFGFRKLAGKGKMAPCSYVNEGVTTDLRSLMLIKRKNTATIPDKETDKDDTKKKRGRSNGSSSESSTAPVNPVLAGILQRNTSNAKVWTRSKLSTAATPLVTGKGIKHSILKHPSTPSASSQQALARAAVGKGVRHGLTRAAPTPGSAKVAALASAVFPDPPAMEMQDPIQESLSQLTSNYRNTLQSLETLAQPDEIGEGGEFKMYNFLSRDTSLVDLAMLVPTTAETAEYSAAEPALAVNEMSSAMLLPFVDFPDHDFNAFTKIDEFREKL